jgi:hypothetical protein
MTNFMSKSKFFSGLIILATGAVLLTGCDWPTKSTEPTLLSGSVDDAANIVEGIEVVNDPTPIGKEPLITGKQVEKFVSDSPAFSFSYWPENFKVEETDHELEEKTGEVKYVGMDYLDPDEPEAIPENIGYFDLKPQLGITVYKVDGEDAVNAIIVKETSVGKPESVTIGNTTFVRANTSGMTEAWTYYLVKGDYLYAIFMGNYPAIFSDENKSNLVNEAFLQVLKTFNVK